MSKASSWGGVVVPEKQPAATDSSQQSTPTRVFPKTKVRAYSADAADAKKKSGQSARWARISQNFNGVTEKTRSSVKRERETATPPMPSEEQGTVLSFLVENRQMYERNVRRKRAYSASPSKGLSLDIASLTLERNGRSAAGQIATFSGTSGERSIFNSTPAVSTTEVREKTSPSRVVETLVPEKGKIGELGTQRTNESSSQPTSPISPPPQHYDETGFNKTPSPPPHSPVDWDQ